MDDATIRRALAEGGSRAAAARILGIPPSTLGDRMRAWGITSPHPRASPYGTTSTAESGVEPGIIPNGTTIPSESHRESQAEPADLVALRRKADRAEAETRSLKAQLKHAVQHANIVEDIRDMLAPVIADCALPKPSKPPRLPRTRNAPLTAVWHLTDLHWGELVDPTNMNGLNAYSPGIAARRVQHTLDTIRRFQQTYESHGFRELVIAVNGDTIGGSIHPDSAEYYARVAKQSVDAALLISQVVHEAATSFDEVRVLGTVGNHPRSTTRMPTGVARIESSWEYLLHEHVAALCSRIPNAQFEIAKGYTLDTVIGPSRWAFQHGDAVKGGGGALGVPAYGLKRQHDAAREWSLVLAELNQHAADSIIKHTRCGHFHTYMWWQAGAADIGLCPSPKGVDPFVKDVLGKYSPPMQLVEVVHPEHDVIAQHPIRLDHIQDESMDCRYVWNGAGTSSEQFTAWAG